MNKVKNNLVSVIVNCHNGEKYVERCIKSILSQSYKKFEIIFWDNKSTDNTFKILKNFKDKRIKYFKSKIFTKLYEARNLAVKKAKGNYISFLDVDDTWDRKKLNEQIKKLKKKNNDVCFTNHWILKDTKKLFKKKMISQNILNQILNDYPISILTVMIKRDIFFKKKIYFDKRFEIIGDFDFFFKLSQFAKFCCINRPLATYHIHGDNLSIRKLRIEINEFDYWISNNKYILNKYSNTIVEKNNIRRCNHLLTQNNLSIWSKEIKYLTKRSIRLKFYIKIILNKLNLI